MPKRIFRKYLPKPDRLREHKALSFLGEVLSDPNLWHINRRSLAGAAFIGVFSTVGGTGVDIQSRHLCANLLFHLPHWRLDTGHAAPYR